MNILDRIIKYGIYLAMFMPLVFTSRTMYPWHFGKTVVFQVLIEILVIIGVSGYFYKKYYLKKGIFCLNELRDRFCALDWFVFAFLLSQVLAAFVGVDFEKSFWGNIQRMQGVFSWLHFGAFYYLLRVYVFSKQDWLKLIGVVVGVAVVSGLIALFGHNFFIFRDVVMNQSRVSGLLGNPIFLAGYLVIPLFLSVVLHRSDKRYKSWYLALMSLILVTIAMTQTRGAYIGVMGGVSVCVALYLRYGFNRVIKQALVNIGLILVILISGFYVVNARSEYFRDNYPKISHLLSINLNETTAKTRLMAWNVGVEGVQSRPAFGWGPENYQDLFDNNYDKEFLDYGFGETVWDKPHNNIVELLSESGYLGLMLYLLMPLMMVVYLIRMITRTYREDERIGYIALVGAIVAFEGQNFFSFFTTDSTIMWIAVMAIVASFSQFDLGEDRMASEEVTKKMFNIVHGGGLLVLVVFCMFGVVMNARIYRASVAMADARDWALVGSLENWEMNVKKSINMDTPYNLELAVFAIRDLNLMDNARKLNKEVLIQVSEGLIEVLEEGIAKNDQSYVYRFWLAQLYSMLGEYVDVVYFKRSNELLEEAAKISVNRQQVPLHLSKNYMMLGENERGAEVLKDLVSVDGERPESHWFLGIALVRNNEIKKGVRELEKGIVFGERNVQNVLYLIEMYVKVDEIGKIAPLYEKLIVREPENAQYYARLAATYAALGDNEKMVKYLDSAVLIDPGLKKEAELFIKEFELEVKK